MKYTVCELVEGSDSAVEAWAREMVDAASTLARKHGLALIGGSTIAGAHCLPPFDARDGFGLPQPKAATEP